MVVIGGYNSSNTTHLAALVRANGVPTYHIEDADCIDPASRHHPAPAGRREAARSSATGWLGTAQRSIGITAGASTPNNKIGETIARICGDGGAGAGAGPPAGVARLAGVRLVDQHPGHGDDGEWCTPLGAVVGDDIGGKAECEGSAHK